MSFFEKNHDYVLKAMMDMKTEVCRVTGCTDIPYTALYVSKDPNLKLFLGLDDDRSIDGEGTMMVGVPIFVKDPYDVDTLIKMLPPFSLTAMAVVCEGYSKPQENLADYRRGDMQKEYESNPFTNVRPGIVLVSAEIETLKIGMSMITYKYDDRGIPKYDLVDGKPPKPHIHNDGILTGGRAVDNIITVAREYIRRRDAKED